MKLILFAICYYILSIWYDTGVYFIGKMNPCSHCTSFFARHLERVAEIMTDRERIINTMI